MQMDRAHKTVRNTPRHKHMQLSDRDQIITSSPRAVMFNTFDERAQTPTRVKTTEKERSTFKDYELDNPCKTKTMHVETNK
jgi:hypothetical protein